LSVAQVRQGLKRLAWFAGLWIVGVASVSIITYAVRLLIGE
jgi:hypothetical protein